MGDDLTLGELARNLSRLEGRLDRALKDLDDRLTALAAKMVPSELWKAEHEALEKDVQELRDDVREAVGRIERTSLERMGVLNGRIDALGGKLDKHEKAHADGSAWSRSKTLTVIGIIVTAAATIGAAWIAAVLAAKGVH